jgi:hypothetical protein
LFQFAEYAPPHGSCWFMPTPVENVLFWEVGRTTLCPGWLTEFRDRLDVRLGVHNAFAWETPRS